MKKNMHGYITILVKMGIYVKFVRWKSEKSGGSRGAWSHRAVHFKDNPGNKLTRHDELR